MNICFVGTGYVGLVSGVLFSDFGNTVYCVDNDKKKISNLEKGIIPIYEPGLEELVIRNFNSKRLIFTTDINEAIKKSDIIFIAVGTPPSKDGNSADLSSVFSVAKTISNNLNKHKIIITKSTVPLGTGDEIEKILSKKNKKNLFDVVSNPEFLREGEAIRDFKYPDRVVIGTNNVNKVTPIMTKLYEPIIKKGGKFIVVKRRAAELIKYAANAFLATKITFMNEIANLCELMGADVDAVRKGIGTDSRIGKRFLFAGIGYGGSCFPKDVRALSKSAEDVQYPFELLNSVMKVNENQKQKLISPLEKSLGNLTGKTIAIWGLAFKPYTDDIREAPALENIRILLEKGAHVRAYDPEAMENVREVLGSNIYYALDEYDAIDGAEALMIMTEWPVFRMPDFDLISRRLKNKLIFDGRNLYDLDQMEKLGFTYHSIGRKVV